MLDFLFTKLREYIWDGLLSSSGPVASVKALGSQGHPQAACRWLHSGRNEVQEEAQGTGSQRTHGMPLNTLWALKANVGFQHAPLSQESQVQVLPGAQSSW